MARRKTSRSIASQKKRPYRKAPQPRRRKSTRRKRFDSLLPTSEQAMATTMAAVEGIRLPRLSRPTVDWLRWSGWRWSKLTGLLVSCLALAGIIWIHMDYHWFVYADTVEFEALTYLTPAELYPADDLERETLGYARRVAENGRTALRMSKLAINKTQDIQGYSAAMEAAFADYLVMSQRGGGAFPKEGERRLGAVDLAVRGLRGERPGLEER